MLGNNVRERRLIPDPQVWKRYSVTSMTGWRWDHNPALNFPKPVVINGRKYRYEDELEDWERQQATRQPSIKRKESGVPRKSRGF